MCRENLGLLVTHLPIQQAESFEDDRLKAKSYLLKESKRDITGREHARESNSISTSASAKRDAGLGVEVTLIGWVLHKNMSCANLF